MPEYTPKKPEFSMRRMQNATEWYEELQERNGTIRRRKAVSLVTSTAVSSIQINKCNGGTRCVEKEQAAQRSIPKANR